MSLIKCPDCGKEISDTAPTCIGCGRVMANPPSGKNNIMVIIGSAFVIVVTGLFFYKSTDKFTTGLKPAESKSHAEISPRQALTEARSSLNSLRSEIQVYYGDHNGVFPAKLEVLTENQKYLKEIPFINLPGHARTNSVKYLSTEKLYPELLTDSGGWVYFNSKRDSETSGMIMFDCIHKDETGKSLWDF